MNSLGYIGIMLVFFGLLGLSIIGLEGGLRGLLETYFWQSFFLAGFIVVGGFLLWLNIEYRSDRPRRGM